MRFEPVGLFCLRTTPLRPWLRARLRRSHKLRYRHRHRHSLAHRGWHRP